MYPSHLMGRIFLSHETKSFVPQDGISRLVHLSNWQYYPPEISTDPEISADPEYPLLLPLANTYTKHIKKGNGSLNDYRSLYKEAASMM